MFSGGLGSVLESVFEGLGVLTTCFRVLTKAVVWDVETKAE